MPTLRRTMTMAIGLGLLLSLGPGVSAASEDEPGPAASSLDAGLSAPPRASVAAVPGGRPTAPATTPVKPPPRTTPAAPAATKLSPTRPAPRPPSDEERIATLLKKKQFDQACPLIERQARASSTNETLWLDLAQCEQHRGRRRQAIEAASHAAEVGSRPARKNAYQLLHALREKAELPSRGCEWLAESAGGVCEDQMWACGYEWELPTQNGRAHGHALTFGAADDELDVLESALEDGSALRPQLASEWKALQDVRLDELACPLCHRRAIDSADGLVNARAVSCFQKRTGHPQPLDVCSQPDTDCETWADCIDEASSLARRADTAKNRALWPEAYDVISAAHQVCDATCGVIETRRCDVVSVDACRGLVGYACVQTRRGRRPTVRIGELSINEGSGNWEELPDAQRAP